MFQMLKSMSKHLDIYILFPHLTPVFFGVLNFPPYCVFANPAFAWTLTQGIFYIYRHQQVLLEQNFGIKPLWSPFHPSTQRCPSCDSTVLIACSALVAGSLSPLLSWTRKSLTFHVRITRGTSAHVLAWLKVLYTVNYCGCSLLLLL